MNVSDGITLFGSGSYQGVITEISENHVFVGTNGLTYTFNKKDIRTGDFTLFGVPNSYGVEPGDSLEWKFYHRINSAGKINKL
jgi:hypothetical protein